MKALNKVCAVLTHLACLAYIIMLFKQFHRPDTPMVILPFHVWATVGIVFLIKPFSKKITSGPIAAFMRLLDIVAVACCVYIIWHYFRDTMRIQMRMEGIDDVEWGDLFAFVVGIPILLEATRRTAGTGMVVLLLIFLGYGFGGSWMPGWFRFQSFGLDTFAELVVLGTEGLYGVCSSSIVSFVFYFIVFGAVFSATGGGKIFIDIAMRATGHLVGGPAKTSIVASALFGTISGSALANVTSTGVLTIPLMMKTGYSAEQAGATEAIASSGGQLMPPIMGVAAFVMADLLGVPYLTIALAGVLPALAFYFALFLNVDLLARKNRFTGIEQKTIESGSDPVLPRLHLLLGPVLLVVALVAGYSAPFAALSGSAGALIAPYLRRHTWYHPKKFYDMAIDIGKQMAGVAVPVTAVGIIIVVSIQSGLAIKFVTLLSQLGQQNLLLSLFLVILGCLILGMGLPTVAAYVIAAVMFVPALSRLGVGRLESNFFVMYYAVLSQVTPPVALAAFAAAAISKGNPYKTGWIGAGLGMAIFLLPFGFVRDPALLWQAPAFSIAMACIGIVCGTGAWAIALQGWLWGLLKVWTRIVFALCCFVIVYEPTFSIGWSVALGVFAALLTCCWVPTLKPLVQKPQ